MSMAIINLPNQEEIIHDLNNQIFNIVQPKSLAKKYWEEINKLITGGVDEETAYSYLNDFLNEYYLKIQ